MTIRDTAKPEGPFESVSELRAEHARLLEALESELQQGGSEEEEAQALSRMGDQVMLFIARGRSTGVYIEEVKERTECQILLDYWVSRMIQSGTRPPTGRLASFDAQQLPDLKDKPCPYAGLDAFRDSNFFFGREEAIKKLLEQIHDCPLVIVLGASGGGKSSLVLGGILPALRGPNASPRLRIIPPIVPGNAAFRHLAGALIEATQGNPSTAEIEAGKLRQEPQHLLTMVGGSSAPPTLITVDQFEELFTLSSEEDREALAASLSHLLQADRGHRVILTMREEFKSHMVELMALSPYLDKAWYSIPPMDYEELKAAVERPAALVNLQFQSGIADDLVKKVLGQPAALPLLQFTLRALWEGRDRNRITWEVYHAVGNPLEALEVSANRFFNDLAPQTQDEVKRILVALVRVDELLEAYRQPLPISQLLSAGRANTQDVLRVLAEQDYIRIASNEAGQGGTVEIKHESLVRNWKLLVAWIDEKRQQRRQRLALTQAAQRWQESAKPDEGLLTEWQLQSAKGVEDLSELEQEFVQASVAAADRVQREKEAELVRQAKESSKRKWSRVVGGILLIGLIAVSWFWKIAREERDRNEDLVGFLLGESFLGELRDTGRSILLSQVQERMQGSKQVTSLNRGLALRNQGDLERMKGQLQNSVRLYEGALNAIESGPANAVHWREAARTRERLGEALADQGYVTLALAQYQGATDAWRRVVQDSSASLEDCTGLADSLVSLGGLQDRMGDANAALAKINEALEIGTEALLGPGPHVKCPLRPAQIAPYLDAKALEILGQVTILRAQMLNLKEDYDGTLAFAEGAARLRPHSVSTRRQALVSRAWWGHGQEDRQRKENAHRRTFDEVNSLLQLDPDNRQWQRERAAIQLVIAQDLTACKSSKDSVPCAAEGAEAAVLEAIATLKALNGIDPGDASRRSDLGWALQAHGELLEAESRGEEALQKLEEAEKEYRNAIMDWKNDVDGLKSYGRLLWQKAKLFASLGRAGDATKVVDEAVRQAADLLAAHPGNQGLVDYLIGARAIESDIRHKVGDMDGAKRAAEEASRLQKGYDDATKRVWTRSDTLYKGFSQHLEAGAGLYEKGDYGGALRELEKAEAVAREYILVRPADREGYKQLANIYDWLRLVRPEDGGTRAKAADLAARMRSAQLAALLAPADQKAEANFDLLKARFDHDKFLYDHADGDPQTLEKVLSLLQAEVVLAESLVQTDSRNALYLWKQGDATAGVGMVRRDLGRPGAEEAMLSGLVYLEKAARIEPSNERYSMDAANVRSMLAQMYREHGRYPDAKKEYSAALKAYQQAARTSPGDRGTLDAIEEINKELAALERARQAGRQGQK